MQASSNLASEILETVPALMGVIRGEIRRNQAASLSVAEFRVLHYVGEHGGTGLSPIADHVGFSLPSASRVVEHLLKQGLLNRNPYPGDRRRIALSLTDAGREEVARAREAAGNYVGEQIAALAPEVREEVTRALRLLRDTFVSAIS